MAGNKNPTKSSSAEPDERQRLKNTGGGSPDACDLTIDIDLEGVRTDAVAGLKIGDVLYLELVQTSNYPVVICKRPNGAVVGSLAAFLSVMQLVKCLQMGVQYDVSVTHVDGGRCHVFGRRK
jgi:hypothetical protein